MARGNIPVVQLRRLRGELRRARELAGLTQKQVADDLGWSLSKVIRQETGAQNISTADVMALVHYYRITDQAQIDSLLAITRAKEQVWWWDEYREVLPRRFVEYIAYEGAAAAIRQFQIMQVPGLLQTTAYARTLFTDVEEPELAAVGLQVRMRRQEILFRENCPDALFVLDEAVIHRIVGGPEVMLEQLTHLRKLNTRPHISIQIVPFSAGVKATMNGSFTILDFSPVSSNNPGSDQDDVDYVVNIEGLGSNTEPLINDNPETTSRYVEAFYGIREIAMSAERTDELIETKIDSIRAGLT